MVNHACDMSDKYFEFNGLRYVVGTVVKINRWNGAHIGSIKTIYPCYVIIIGENLYEKIYKWDMCDRFIEIVTPVYLKQQQDIITNDRTCPPAWEVEMGLVWYVVIMLVGSIFKDRFIIWTVATVYFFLWKNGFFGGKRK